MKRKLSLLLIFALLLGLLGCSAAETPGIPTTTPTQQVTEAPTQEPTQAPTQTPTTAPTQVPTEAPTQAPTEVPTQAPTQKPTEAPTQAPTQAPTESPLDEDGSYTTKEDVALYLHIYGRLPSNFMTKNEAKQLGWKSGSLERYAPGKCIGGDVFQNREGLLPKKSGRTYYECDIDTMGSYGNRGSKRIVYSNDGLVYYTSDHYESFTLLYGDPS